MEAADSVPRPRVCQHGLPQGSWGAPLFQCVHLCWSITGLDLPQAMLRIGSPATLRGTTGVPDGVCVYCLWRGQGAGGTGRAGSDCGDISGLDMKSGSAVCHFIVSVILFPYF